MGFDPICGMHVGLQGFSCLVLCGFINSIPHKVGVTVSGVPAQTGSYPILKCRTATVAAARSLQNPYSPQNPYASLPHPETQYRKQPQPRQNQIQPETSNEPPESYP